MDSLVVVAPQRRELPLLAAWLVALLAAGALAMQVGEVVRGGSDAVPGSESIEAVDRAVAAGVPAGTFYPFVAVLHSDNEVVEDAQFAAAAREVSAALLDKGAANAVQSAWNTGDAGGTARCSSSAPGRRPSARRSLRPLRCAPPSRPCSSRAGSVARSRDSRQCSTT